MPEGDTIHRAARRLDDALADATVNAATGVPAADLDPLEGTTVRSVEALGKHLLIGTTCGTLLHTHMAMTGSWHLYRPEEAWQKPARNATLVLHVTSPRHGALDAVGFSIPTVVVGNEAVLRKRPPLIDLGPDLLGARWDLDAATARVLAQGSRPIGAALLDQRVVSGIGNVYKSEVLFIERIDPFASVASLGSDAVRRVLSRTRRLMQANLRGGMRKTTAPDVRARAYVYERSGLPCLRCTQRIGMRRQGEHGRSTYFCPVCQSVASSATGRVPR